MIGGLITRFFIGQVSHDTTAIVYGAVIVAVYGLVVASQLYALSNVIPAMPLVDLGPHVEVVNHCAAFVDTKTTPILTLFLPRSTEPGPILGGTQPFAVLQETLPAQYEATKVALHTLDPHICVELLTDLRVTKFMSSMVSGVLHCCPILTRLVASQHSARIIEFKELVETLPFFGTF